VEQATTPEEAECFLYELGQLHIKQWGDTHDGSGFQSTFFTNFQRDLLLNHPDFAHIFRVSFGRQTIGYTLNYVSSNSVYFYCSGIDHTIASSKVKPGYVMHCILMSQYAERGYKRYDFLGGDSQYKRSLSDTVVTFHSILLTSSTLKGRFLSLLRKIKSNYTTWRQNSK